MTHFRWPCHCQSDSGGHGSPVHVILTPCGWELPSVGKHSLRFHVRMREALPHTFQNSSELGLHKIFSVDWKRELGRGTRHRHIISGSVPDLLRQLSARTPADSHAHSGLKSAGLSPRVPQPSPHLHKHPGMRRCPAAVALCAESKESSKTQSPRQNITQMFLGHQN